MRSIAAIACLVVAVTACSGKSLETECPSASRTGPAPHCVLSATCGTAADRHFVLDCTETNGTCACSVDGPVDRVIPYQSEFCEGGDATSEAAVNGALDAASDACGWNL